jgi:hypothetical protein
MVRIRHGWLVVVLGLGLGLGLAFVTACKKDDSSGGKAGNSSGTAAFDEDISMLPRDSEVVIGINVAQAMQSGLWKQFAEPKLTTGETMRKLGEFKAKCGIDPMTAVKSVAIGMKGVAGGKPDGAVVVHGMDKAKAMPCLDSMKDDMAKDGIELSHDGDVALFKNTRTGVQVALTYVNDNTALAVFGEQANTASLKAAQAGGQALKSSQPFLDMYHKINTGDSLWLLLSGKVLEKAAQLGVKTNAVFGSFNVTDGLALDLRMRFETPDDAAKFATMSKSQAQQASKSFDKVDITNDGAEVRFVIALSSQKLKEMVAQLSGLLGAFGGMGGGMGGP